ncbi:hypothetical protein B0E53_02713 [Micromonospora sp. MH33]|nr:hypothetical protein B0E53_02713 [Micromonospora sp. MH33]
MWACLQDQDTTGQWKQVAGWRKVCDLALAHLSRLREYRRGLAEAWPPETNAAARAYLGELDKLIDQVQRTHDAAAANYDALAAATRAIGSTRAELQPLHDEYAEKVRQKRAYEAILADPKAVAGSRLPEKPPVTDADLEQLNVRARGLMTGLSGELQQAQVMLQRPPAVAPRPGPRVDQQPTDPYSGAGSIPIIPPVVAVPVASPVRTQATGPISSPLPAPTPPAHHKGSVIGQGPVLGGAGTGVTPTPAASTGHTPPTLSTPHTGGTGFPLPPTSTASIRGIPSDRLPNNQGIGRELSSRPTASTPPRSMPPGGLIGSSPTIGQPGAAPRRVNPIGGVIGGGGAGTAPSGAAGSRPGVGKGPHFGGYSPSPLGGGPAIGGGARKAPPHPSDGDQSSRRWDPDNPWELDHGVDPVVRPPDENGPIDPGPAIGFDR